MKKPLLSQTERWFITNDLNSMAYENLELKLAIARIKQAFGKSWLIQKVIKPTVEYLASILPPPK